MKIKPIVIDGAYPSLFNSFVEYKRGIGYGYPEQTVGQIRQLSRFLADFPSSENVLCEEAVEMYCSPRDGEAVSTRNKRAVLVRQFALYLQTLGIKSYVPPEKHEKADDYIPHIFTDAEMSAIIACADNQPFFPHTPATKAVYSMLIRMLWCCGLRLGEALSLTVGDVDIDEAVLTIKRAKHGKTRLVPMSNSLAAYTRRYWDQMGFARENPYAFFYATYQKERYARTAVSKHIQRIMLRSGVVRDGEKPPRVHDIRHSYAVRALKKMEEDGMDIYCSLPLLSIYMGHSDIKSTEYYLRLTGNAFSEISGAMDDCYKGVFPEVD